MSGNQMEVLSRFCLERDPIEAKRALAWVDSICFAYLVIGIFSLGSPTPVIHKAASIALEAAPVIVEPLASAPAEAAPDEAPGEKAPEQPGAAVMVTLDSPEVAFSVPTIGNVLVPLTMAAAPPPKPMEKVMPITTVPREPVESPGGAGSAPPPPHLEEPPRIEQIRATGIEGSRPAPPYPEESLMNREAGRVVLLIEVDESGRITSVTVKSSSGYSRLDQVTADCVRRHWLFEPAGGPRKFEAPISFHLNE